LALRRLAFNRSQDAYMNTTPDKPEHAGATQDVVKPATPNASEAPRKRSGAEAAGVVGAVLKVPGIG
jgi:hypothetical protein